MNLCPGTRARRARFDQCKWPTRHGLPYNKTCESGGRGSCEKLSAPKPLAFVGAQLLKKPKSVYLLFAISR